MIFLKFKWVKLGYGYLLPHGVLRLIKWIACKPLLYHQLAWVAPNQESLNEWNNDIMINEIMK